MEVEKHQQIRLSGFSFPCFQKSGEPSNNFLVLRCILSWNKTTHKYYNCPTQDTPISNSYVLMIVSWFVSASWRYDNFPQTSKLTDFQQTSGRSIHFQGLNLMLVSGLGITQYKVGPLAVVNGENSPNLYGRKKINSTKITWMSFITQPKDGSP